MKQHYTLIPKQAFLLFPQGKDVYFEQKGNSKRLIYGNGQYPAYTEKQRQRIEDFKEYIKRDPISKEMKENDQTLLLKMIYANKYNLENALSNLKDFKKWQSQFVPVQSIDPGYRQKMDDLLKTGIFYASPTRDQYFKPMIIVHVGRLLKVKPDLKLFIDTFGYFLQTAINQMMIEGQVQTWNVIVDVDQTSVFSFAGALFDLIKFLSRIFIGRMYRCYIIDYPFLIKFVWGTVSMMMDAQQNEKCRILTKQEMIKLIPKQTLQEKYGGELPPLKDFWPLNSPQRIRIQKSAQQKMRKYWLKQNHLVSQAEYFQRHKQGKIGSKICYDILKKFQKPQPYVPKIVIQKRALVQKLSQDEANRLNSIIKIQKKPYFIKVVEEQSHDSGRTSNRESAEITQQKSTNLGQHDAKQKRKNSNFFEVIKQVFSQETFSSLLK